MRTVNHNIPQKKPGALSPKSPSPAGRRDRDEGRWQLFAKVDLDVFLVGFDLTKPEVTAPDPTNETAEGDTAGWFFVLEERAGDVRFGADVPASKTGLNNTSSGQPVDVQEWQNLNWGYIADAMDIDNLENVIYINANINLVATNDSPPWSQNSANVASILFQPHVRIAIHADQMIK